MTQIKNTLEELKLVLNNMNQPLQLSDGSILIIDGNRIVQIIDQVKVNDSTSFEVICRGSDCLDYLNPMDS